MRAGHRRANPNPNDEAATPAKDDLANRNGVTLSGLLNVLDGFHAPENVVYAMTTNHVEALDPALLRPGRTDYKLFLGEASEWQRAELYRRFFPGATHNDARYFAEAHCAETMAEFQGLLLGLEQDAECGMELVSRRS